MRGIAGGRKPGTRDAEVRVKVRAEKASRKRVSMMSEYADEMKRVCHSRVELLIGVFLLMIRCPSRSQHMR